MDGFGGGPSFFLFLFLFLFLGRKNQLGFLVRFGFLLLLLLLPVSLVVPCCPSPFRPPFVSHFWRSLWLCTPVLSAIHVVVHAKGVHNINVNSNAFA